ncbi:methionyl-tRNA formyltransferase [Fluviibacter phosphoraccumulans]|uniref:Methionyl-tRNA formyltransferase n=1 Tax=Fluviibacter phosphoraccumulans TaxID=1751046 RepID=A0A7R6TNP5_9RHOO|nr:methionyl-tRNA formyltransferase [Fluviibacter phosphoraccumulans]BBU68229.1 methionyl-tRNA formyltransferase [Fluviibacter phosphoraccumulans]BBU70232.1 methionyl-tRNA formyltransferase [Fluviibacter phosphoraccumulans]
MTLRVGFAGTPAFAQQALQAILDAGFNVVVALTQPDRPSGRGMQLTPSPVKQLASSHGIPVEQPVSLRNDEAQALVRGYNLDVLVVVAYGLILPQAVLDMPRYGCLNIHASILPRWRGAAPIHRAIEAGDQETGVCIMQMDAGLDTGGVVDEARLSIQATDTTALLHDRLAALGAERIVAVLQQLAAGATLTAVPQAEVGVTYAHKLEKQESLLDLQAAAHALDRKIRAYNPFPGAVLHSGEQPIKIWGARVVRGAGEPGQVLSSDDTGVVVACGEGALCLEVLQTPGGKRLRAADFLRGHPLPVGTLLT